MECTCDDWVALDWCRTVTIRSRGHVCDECGQTIPDKTNFELVIACEDGEPYHFCTCQFCQRVRDDLRSQGYCVYNGALWDGIEQAEKEAEEEAA